MSSRTRLIGFIAALQVSQVPLHVQAQTWTHVTTKGGTSAYFDASSVRRSDATLQALVLSSFSEPTRLRVAGGPLRKQSITYLTSFDCASKSFFVQVTVWYDAPMAGGAAHTIISRVKPQWVSPDSKLYAGNLNVDILMVLCGKR